MEELNQSTRQTPGEVIAWMREDPDYKALVQAAYYDDLADASARFGDSAEFGAVMDIAKVHGIHPGATVLDLGGGNGVAALAWAAAGYSTILLEPDPDPLVGYGAIQPMIGSGQTTVRVWSAFGEAIPVPDQYFDIVYVRQVLHHIPDLDALCREVYRVLRPGGMFLVTREHIIDHERDLPVFFEKHLLHRYTQGENAYLLTQYQQATVNAGFQLEATLLPWSSPINYYPTTPKDVREMAVRGLKRYVGLSVARGLVSVPGVLDAIAYYRNRKDHRPGRMVSFIAVRAS